MNKGFTIIELIISVAIFALMTGLLLAKYGTFNQGVILTNLAYDVALTIRTAQSYGLNVKSAYRTADAFDKPYGVHFVRDAIEFIFFVDNSGDNNRYNGNGSQCGTSSDTECISKTMIKRGSMISNICAGSSSSSCSDLDNYLDITFKRPDPNAIIIGDGVPSSYAEITLEATDGTTKKVMVRSTGQIDVID